MYIILQITAPLATIEEEQAVRVILPWYPDSDGAGYDGLIERK